MAPICHHNIFLEAHGQEINFGGKEKQLKYLRTDIKFIGDLYDLFLDLKTEVIFVL